MTVPLVLRDLQGEEHVVHTRDLLGFHRGFGQVLRRLDGLVGMPPEISSDLLGVVGSTEFKLLWTQLAVSANWGSFLWVSLW